MPPVGGVCEAACGPAWSLQETCLDGFSHFVFPVRPNDSVMEDATFPLCPLCGSEAEDETLQDTELAVQPAIPCISCKSQGLEL